ncbi:glycogen/starch synthase [Haloplasma contractile]|uniref:starch synthase n=1 Tax=Haloplasma contractile SSD-17B TaxID=1033810 RepID=U2EE57_9MOLU|nr:glycogen/starch synthase [Haloplasma contractile]ERJ12991.1 Glycogen synthase protein [Haloplasma contractile SSD-17B]
MRVYEYAKQRDIKSKDVVEYIKASGYSIKNHMAKIPEGIINELNHTQFDSKPKKKKRNPKNIIVISMECTPFINTGLGALVGNKVAQHKVKENNTSVILPLYKVSKEQLTVKQKLVVTIGDSEQEGTVYQYSKDEVSYYFIENDYYFGREKLYGFYDDAERFAFMSKIALELINSFERNVDIINFHDWTLSLIPILYKDGQGGEDSKSVLELSVYGATYQGIYDKDVLTYVFGLSDDYFNSGLVEYAGSLNMLKAGLVTADKLDINKVALDDLKKSYLKDFVQ